MRQSASNVPPACQLGSRLVKDDAREESMSSKEEEEEERLVFGEGDDRIAHHVTLAWVKLYIYS